MTLEGIRADIRKGANRKKARLLQGFFKTGPGEYGEGDIFLGLTVPQIRAVAGKHNEAPFTVIDRLLASPFHEERLLALLLLVRRFDRGDPKETKRVYEYYLAHTQYVNNWDLVDLTAPNIVGTFLLNRSRKRLHRLAESSSLWERRISIVATAAFIRAGEFEDTLHLAKKLLDDKEDLIHKATGWMLREVGKRDLKTEEAFLKTCYNQMPRTMLRYAIEKFPETKRQRYLRGNI